MKAINIAIASVILVSGCAGPSYRERLLSIRDSESYKVEHYASSTAQHISLHGEDSAKQKSLRFVADGLRDPDSALFRNVRLVKFSSGAVFCGEVNGKNAYGGYVGYRAFVAGTSGATILESSRYTEIDDASNYGIRSACGY